MVVWLVASLPFLLMLRNGPTFPSELTLLSFDTNYVYFFKHEV